MGYEMDQLIGVGIALLLTLPIIATMAVGMVFALFARTRTYALVPTVGSLRMNDDGSLSEVENESDHILAA